VSIATPNPSIYQVSPVVDSSIILATGFTTIQAELNAENLVRPRCPCDPAEVNSFDRSVIGNDSQSLSLLSDVTLGLAIVLPPLLDLYDLGLSQAFFEDLVVYAQTLTVTSAFSSLAKITVQRPIPLVYAGEPDLITSPSGYGSFYSGHTALTFATLFTASMTVNLRHHWGVWPWIASGAIGLSVGAERIAAGRHFYTDVAMGTLAGAVVGVLVPVFHTFGSKNEKFALAPTSDGLYLSWTRRF
jgi:membrane-associated phospholipid phosphatase